MLCFTVICLFSVVIFSKNWIAVRTWFRRIPGIWICTSLNLVITIIPGPHQSSIYSAWQARFDLSLFKFNDLLFLIVLVWFISELPHSDSMQSKVDRVWSKKCHTMQWLSFININSLFHWIERLIIFRKFSNSTGWQTGLLPKLAETFCEVGTSYAPTLFSNVPPLTTASSMTAWIWPSDSIYSVCWRSRKTFFFRNEKFRVKI